MLFNEIDRGEDVLRTHVGLRQPRESVIEWHLGSELRMPRYFIDTDDGRHFCQDEDGAHFANVSDAEALAVRTLSEIARDTTHRGALSPLCARVRDDAGAVLATARLQVTVERSPG